MSEVTFQKAEADNSADVAAYLALEKKMSGSKMYATSQDEVEAKKDLTDCAVYFIKQGDKIIGSTSYEIKSPDEVYLAGLLIDPEFQGQGIARQAIEFRLNKVKNFKRVWVRTHPHNSKIIHLYLSYGFTIEDWIDNVHGDGEPRLILVREK